MLRVFLYQSVTFKGEVYMRHVWTSGGGVYYAEDESMKQVVEVEVPYADVPQFFNVKGYFRGEECWATCDTTSRYWKEKI